MQPITPADDSSSVRPEPPQKAQGPKVVLPFNANLTGAIEGGLLCNKMVVRATVEDFPYREHEAWPHWIFAVMATDKKGEPRFTRPIDPSSKESMQARTRALFEEKPKALRTISKVLGRKPTKGEYKVWLDKGFWFARIPANESEHKLLKKVEAQHTKLTEDPTES